MNRPWIGEGIWNQICKEKKPNIQDDSCEIRKKKEDLETAFEKEDVDVVADSDKDTVFEKEDVDVVADSDKETAFEKEDVDVVADSENETALEKEDVEVVADSENETKFEKEDVEVVADSENETVLEKEDVEVVADSKNETALEKEDVEVVADSENEEIELEKEDVGTKSEIKSLVRSMVMKTPFSITSEVSSFLKSPNISIKKQGAFVFQNEKNAGYRELDAKLLTTVQYYHGKAYCKLVSSKLHEKREFLESSNPKVEDDIEKNRIEASSWIPIHSMKLEKEREGEFNDYITVKLPIEIGKYQGEISLREKVVFKEKVTEIKDVSQEIILTKNEFLLPKIKKTGQNPVTIEKAGLLVEGYIYQCIEYTIEQSTSHDNVYQLMQNIVLELTIQVLQEQEVRVLM
ncbi:BC_2427 family protein [Bacillus albus]|uniref:BC_2427 family protein n=1 Tax=Bacillus albus TaxID=2026189 RepID=UPI003D1B65AB